MIDAFVGTIDAVFLTAATVMLVALAFLLKETPLDENEVVTAVKGDAVPVEE